MPSSGSEPAFSSSHAPQTKRARSTGYASWTALLVFSTVPILFSGGRKSKDPVVLLTDRAAIGIVVGGRYPERPVRRLRHVPNPPSLPVEQFLSADDLPFIV